ncbi:hypothetical protein [Marinisporobacter balticus]|uniref:Uncharacterized protein n=1 Tax=Marinisporobacter balticus TaxID=2018667 RepID=A0A4V2SCI4_9FIRM|nr:hypothetical protein [Marinisporobacter balticus]TCO79400.1 hypothetical protein EV214_102118 [Marinisporobacter balticus]
MKILIASTKKDWKGISGIGVIVSKREILGITSLENSYFIYSMKDVTAEKTCKRGIWGEMYECVLDVEYLNKVINII